MMFSWKKMLPTALLAGIALLALSGAASACPNCKNALLESGDLAAARMKDGYFWSYVAMTSMPFILLGTVTVLLLRSARKSCINSSSCR